MSISDVPLPPKTSKELGDLIGQSKTLTELSLTTVTLDSEGFKSIMEGVLKQGSGAKNDAATIERLDLSGNDLTDECVELISQAIVECTGLNVINLCLNSLTQTGAEALFEAMEKRRLALSSDDTDSSEKIKNLEDALEACHRAGVKPDDARVKAITKLLMQLQEMAANEPDALELDLRGNFEGPGTLEYVTSSSKNNHTPMILPPPEEGPASSAEQRTEAIKFIMNAELSPEKRAEVKAGTMVLVTQSKYDDVFKERLPMSPQVTDGLAVLGEKEDDAVEKSISEEDSFDEESSDEE